MCACVGVCLGSQYLRCVDEGYALRVTEQRAVANRRALNVRSSVKRDLQGSVVSVKRTYKVAHRQALNVRSRNMNR